MIKNEVESLLKLGQTYRDSDKLLLLAIWEKEGLILTGEQKQRFIDCTTAETITRARRSLKHKYPASDKVDERRFEKYNQYRQGTFI